MDQFNGAQKFVIEAPGSRSDPAASISMEARPAATESGAVRVN